MPHFLNRPFLEKPPLYFATAGVFYRVFGTTCEGVGRFASVIFAIGTLLVVFFGTRAIYTEQTAGLSTLILATSFKFFEISHKMMVDIALCFFITAALFSFALAYKDKSSWGYKLFWISLALAFMTKGLIGIGIPLAVVILFALWQEDFSLINPHELSTLTTKDENMLGPRETSVPGNRSLIPNPYLHIKKMWVLPGILLIALVMIAWGWVLYTRGGVDFLRTFYFYNQFGRFFHGGSYLGGHIRPFYYYLTTVWTDAAPWFLLLIPAFISTRRLEDTTRFMYAWFLAGLIILSISSTKRGLYFLPMYPAMAVIIAQWMSSIIEKGAVGWQKLFLWFVMGLILLAGLLAPFAYVKLGGLWWIAFVMLGLTIGIFWYIWVHSRKPFPLVILISWALLLLLWTPLLIPRIDQEKDYKPFFEDMGKVVSDKHVIGCQLTETVEALCLFYGGVYVEDIEDRDIFAEIIREGDLQHVLILPSRVDAGIKELMGSRGKCVLKVDGRARRKIELWRIGNKQNY